MYTSNALAKIDEIVAVMPATDNGSTALLSTQTDAEEALCFLAARPVHTVNLRAFIRDNGLSSTRNRGRFYGYRNSEGRLEGVALIGHATLVETSTDRALESLARTAQEECACTHLIMGERGRVEEFWNYYCEGGQKMRLACRELLFELRCPFEVQKEVTGLRQATLEDLDLIIPVQAAMAEAESGVNPLVKDPAGFRARCARRIEAGRTWVLVEDGKLIFKTEVFAETPEVIYLEGVYVNPDERGQGIGLRCLSQLSRTLLRRTQSLCILVNEENEGAHAFYKRAGFKFVSTYDTVFLQQD